MNILHLEGDCVLTVLGMWVHHRQVRFRCSYATCVLLITLDGIMKATCYGTGAKFLRDDTQTKATIVC
jgi:hypothetical protein